MSDNFIDDVKTKIEALRDAYKTDFGNKLVFSTAPFAATLKAPVSLAQIGHFLQTVFGDAHDLPDLPLSGADLTRFSLSKADDSAGTANSAEIAIAFRSGSLKIAEGLEIALKSVSLCWWNGSWSGDVQGQLKVRGKRFDVRMNWPSMVLEGHLATGENAGLKKLATDHQLGVTRNSSPELTQFQLYVAARIHHVELNIAAKNLLKIGPVSLTECDLGLVYAGGLDAQFTGQVHGVILVGDVEFDLLAAKTEQGWRGEASAHTRMSLEEIVKAVSKTVHGRSHSVIADGVSESIANKPIDGDVRIFVETAAEHVVLSTSIAAGAEGTAHFSIEIAKSKLTIKADLEIDGLIFEAGFLRDATQSYLAGQFSSEAGLSLSLRDLARMTSIEGQHDLGSIGDAVKVTVRDMLVGLTSADDESRLLLAADIDGGIDLSGLGDLPLIGDLLPKDNRVSLALSPLIANQDWDEKSIKELGKLCGEKGPHLPEKIARGVSLGASLQLPDEAKPLNLELEIDAAPAQGEAAEISAPANAPQKSDIKWKDIHAGFGPVHVQRLGLQLEKPTKSLRILLDGDLSVAGLTVSLVGLGGAYSLDRQKLDLELSGLGLDFRKGALEIAGAFGNIDGDYVGKVLLRAKTFSVSASGGFAMIDDMPSMFLYGVLSTPMGGPPFFFVEGLAAGFGFNRSFKAPAINQVREFPFVKDAIGAADGADREKGDMASELARLHDYISPELGQYFLAVGVKFTSFKLLSSFVLLVVSAGKRLKLDLIGTSTYQTPPIVPSGLPALARIEINLIGSIVPATGSIKVRAELAPNSYVYSSLCKLAGGFAFYSWFDGPHAGDFVLSAGGYHPNYKRPPHYPPVKRISLTYQITENIYVKGSAYFALTPSMFMAGGALEAHAKIGSVSATFRASIDFMMSWEPYHYDAWLNIDIKAKWKCFHTTAHAGLHIWGPSFAGHAEVSWACISFDVDFGGTRKGPVPITWKKFEASFLPKNTECSLTVQRGLTASLEQKSSGSAPPEKLHIINPKELVLSVDSILPVLSVGGKNVAKKSDLGCGPIGAKSLKSSALKVEINRRTHNRQTGRVKETNLTGEFATTPIAKTFPSAMWGKKLSPALSDKPVSACGGLQIWPKARPTRPAPKTIKRGEVAYDDEKTGELTSPAVFRFSKTASGNAKAVLSAPQGDSTSKNRAAVLSSLGLSFHTGLPDATLVDAMTNIPLVVSSKKTGAT